MQPDELKLIETDLMKAAAAQETVTSPDILVLVFMLITATVLAWFVARKYGVSQWFCLIVPLAGFFSLYLGLMAFLILLAVNRDKT